MIDYITGNLVNKNPAYAIIEKNGIAFKLLIPLSSYSRLPESGEVKLYTFLYGQNSLQETSFRLYGFKTLAERQLFLLLAGVNRVGPSMALRILSGTSVGEFRQAVISENLNYLSTIKGVGSKTAQRIILELKKALSDWELPPVQDTDKQEKETAQKTGITDAILALVALGYQRQIADKCVRQALNTIKDNFKTEDLVKKALQQG